LEYIHQRSNNNTEDYDAEIKTISGYYTIEKEVRLEYNNQLILCVIGMGKVDSSCCGTGGCRYALVPGYIRQWMVKKDESGRLISDVEPVADEKARKEISKILKDEEVVTQINFW